MIITHPLHPFVGRTLPLLQHLRYLGRACVVLRFPDGHAAKVPVDWTDLRPWPPPLKFRGKCPKLHPESLRELSVWMEELGQRSTSHGQQVRASEKKLRPAADAGRALHGAARGAAARTAGRAGRRTAESRGRVPRGKR
ncbi:MULTISPECIES: DUF5372 family protein [unclassified Corallococcus]|uniref:DUF5372 family protein n=1 Tax=unclassified Corallococcus TaxID=2685029 RepID=UPI001315AAE9